MYVRTAGTLEKVAWGVTILVKPLECPLLTASV